MRVLADIGPNVGLMRKVVRVIECVNVLCFSLLVILINSPTGYWLFWASVGETHSLKNTVLVLCVFVGACTCFAYAC